MDQKINELKKAINKCIIGKEKVTELVISALIAGGHVLLEDVPGVGKTSMAKALAKALDMSFKRIQLTPDTLPSDIMGSTVYDRNTGEFKSKIGPVNANIVLADELNRTSPKTQAALLEAMEEKQVTIDGTTYTLPDPFFVIATQNPIGAMGTYPLPDAELDRFMMKLSVGYPSSEDALIMGKSFLNKDLGENITAVMNRDDILRIRNEVEKISISDELISYAMSLIEATRNDKDVICGCSPRASLDLLKAAEATAYIRERDYVIPEDIYDMAVCVLSHRIVLSSEAKMNRQTGETVAKRILADMPIPE